MDSCIPKEEEEMYLPVSPLLSARKIVSDDSWHIPGFLSTLSNCWTQKSLVAERLNGYSRVCFSQASWIFTRDGSAFNFPRDATLLAIWGFPSGLRQGKILMSYEHQLLAQKTKTWKTEKILFYQKNGRKTAFSQEWNKWKHGKKRGGGFNGQNFRDVLN